MTCGGRKENLQKKRRKCQRRKTSLKMMKELQLMRKNQVMTSSLLKLKIYFSPRMKMFSGPSLL